MRPEPCSQLLPLLPTSPVGVRQVQVVLFVRAELLQLLLGFCQIFLGSPELSEGGSVSVSPWLTERLSTAQDVLKSIPAGGGPLLCVPRLREAWSWWLSDIIRPLCGSPRVGGVGSATFLSPRRASRLFLTPLFSVLRVD